MCDDKLMVSPITFIHGSFDSRLYIPLGQDIRFEHLSSGEEVSIFELHTLHELENVAAHGLGSKPLTGATFLNTALS